MVRFPVQDIKGHMMDIRTADGSIVKISTAGNGDQELTKTLGVEMVQNMYKVQEMLVQKHVTIIIIIISCYPFRDIGCQQYVAI
jgi:hypothetical protein